MWLVAVFNFWYVIPSLALVFALIFLLVTIQKLQQKNQRIQAANEELFSMNRSLESTLQTRTDELNTALKRAQESDRLKTNFLANMSHEVRSPLNGILGFSRLLYQDDLPIDKRKQYIDIINRRSRNLLQIVNDIINISQIYSGQLEIKKVPFNLNQLLYDLFFIFNSVSHGKKKQSVELKLLHSLSNTKSTIISDPIRLEQIITNLLDNALKYTMEGFVEFGYRIENDDTILFFVKDTGIGIPDKERDKVFNRFYVINERNRFGSSGTGLGLPICKGLAELLNGQIWFESQEDAGTTFFLSIPYIPAQPEKKTYLSRSSISSQKLNFNDKIILVVEDDLNSYQFIETLLSETDAKLIHAKNGEDAVEICRISSNIDLILMDMRLPFLDGYQATQQIKAINPDFTIIAQTAHAMSDDKAKCLKAGCDDYIPKPIDPDDFLRIVAQHLKNPAVC